MTRRGVGTTIRNPVRTGDANTDALAWANCAVLIDPCVNLLADLSPALSVAAFNTHIRNALAAHGSSQATRDWELYNAGMGPHHTLYTQVALTVYPNSGQYGCYFENVMLPN